MYFGLAGQEDTDDVSTVDFPSILKASPFDLKSFLDIQGILTQVRNSGDQFSRVLIAHPDVIQHLIDGALRPHKVNITDVQHSYLCCQIIAVQGEVFFQYLFGPPPPTQNEPLVNEIVDESESQPRQGRQSFLYLFEALHQNTLLDCTVGGYLMRMFSQIQYQGPEQVFKEFVSNPQLVKRCLNHLGNLSVMEVLIRVVSTYGENVLKSPEKAKLALQIFTCPFESVSDVDVTIQQLQNLRSFAIEMIQKRCEFSEFICQDIISVPVLSFVGSFVEKQKLEFKILEATGEILSVLIHFYIKQEKKPVKKAKHLMDFGEDHTQVPLKTIPEEVLTCFVQLAKSLLKFSEGKSPVVPVKLMADISKVNTNHTHFFLGKEQFGYYKHLLDTRPHNNILHNSIKNIIVQGLKHDQYQCLDQIILLISEGIKSEVEYKNQLYHVSMAIPDQKGSKNQGWAGIENWQQVTKQLYNQTLPLGGPSKKVRQLNQFFQREQIVSEDEDISSEERSPSNKGSTRMEEEFPDILTHSDDERDFKKSKGPDVSPDISPDISPDASLDVVATQKQTPMEVWKKVLNFSLDLLLSDLGRA